MHAHVNQIDMSALIPDYYEFMIWKLFNVLIMVFLFLLKGIDV